VILPHEIAVYILNRKRHELLDLELTFDIALNIVGSANIPWDKVEIQPVVKDSAEGQPPADEILQENHQETAASDTAEKTSDNDEKNHLKRKSRHRSRHKRKERRSRQRLPQGKFCLRNIPRILKGNILPPEKFIYPIPRKTV